MGWCFAEIGSIERARQCNEHAVALARELGDPEILINANVNLAMNALALSGPDQARAQLDPVEEILAASTDPWMRWRYSLHVHHARGAIALAQGAADIVLSAAELELRNATAQRAPKIAARAYRLRAAALLTMDQRDDAESALLEARAIAERIGHQRARSEAHRGWPRWRSAVAISRTPRSTPRPRGPSRSAPLSHSPTHRCVIGSWTWWRPRSGCRRRQSPLGSGGRTSTTAGIARSRKNAARSWSRGRT